MKYVSYCGKDAGIVFLESIFEEEKRLLKIISNDKEMEPLTRLQMEEFEASTICHICKERILPTEIKVKDHCHFTGNQSGK